MGYAKYIYMGKECGYAVEATCEENGCTTRIDRGMAYACGGEPGEHDDYCEGYFCQDHLFFTDSDYGSSSQRCKRCADDIDEVLEEWIVVWWCEASKAQWPAVAGGEWCGHDKSRGCGFKRLNDVAPDVDAYLEERR